MRDKDIVQKYKDGESVRGLCSRYRISRARVYQILTAAGEPRRVRSRRDLFLGVNLSQSVKDALLIEATRRGISMSSLSSNTLQEMLIAAGYPMEAEKVEIK